MRDYNHLLAQSFCAYYDAHSLKYDFDEQAGVLRSGFPVKDCKLSQIQMAVVFYEAGFTAYGVLPLTATKDKLDDAALYLTRANWGLRNGCFELNMATGEIRYKVYCTTGEAEATERQAAESILIPMQMVKRYGDGLVQVLFGLLTPEQAITAIEKAPISEKLS